MDLTPKQQTSEAIRQASSILILTGQRPTVDQTASLIGFAMILRKVGKDVTAVVSEQMPAALSLLDTSMVSKSLGGPRDFVLKLDVTKAEVDKLRYDVSDGKLNIVISPFKGNFAPSDVTFGYGDAQIGNFDLVIVLGVPSRSRIDKVYEQNASVLDQVPLVNIDFHRINENYGAVNLIDPNASSLSEILIALSESLQAGLVDEAIATPFLMAIVAATDRFTATHTTAKSLTVAAQMMAAGAKQQSVIKALYRDGRERGETREQPKNERNDRGGERTSDRGTDASRSKNVEPRRNEPRQPEREARQPEREPRAEQPRPEQPRAEQPRHEEPMTASQPAPQPAPMPAPAPIPAPAPMPVQPAPQPQSQPLSRPAMNQDAVVRQQATSPELPIISPSHIEMSPMPSSAAPMATEAPAYTADAGQLPPEMSPLVDFEPPVVAPGQQPLAMPMPSSLRDDA